MKYETNAWGVGGCVNHSKWLHHMECVYYAFTNSTKVSYGMIYEICILTVRNNEDFSCLRGEMKNAYPKSASSISSKSFVENPPLVILFI